MPLLDLADRLCTGLASRYRNAYLRARGVRIDGYCWLRAIELPRLHRHVHLDACSLDRGVVLLCSGDAAGDDCRIHVGRGAYVNRGTVIDAVVSVVIGPDAAIGPGCYITDHDHGTADPSLPPLAQPMVSRPTRIGAAAWVGAHAVVLKGVTVGDRAVVGAGSVVTKDVPPGAVVVGNPARVVRQTA